MIKAQLNLTMAYITACSTKIFFCFDYDDLANFGAIISPKFHVLPLAACRKKNKYRTEESFQSTHNMSAGKVTAFRLRFVVIQM